MDGDAYIGSSSDMELDRASDLRIRSKFGTSLSLGSVLNASTAIDVRTGAARRELQSSLSLLGGGAKCELHSTPASKETSSTLGETSLPVFVDRLEPWPLSYEAHSVLSLPITGCAVSGPAVVE